MVTPGNKHELNSLHLLDLLAAVFYSILWWWCCFFSKSERNTLNTSFVIQCVKGPRERMR